MVMLAESVDAVIGVDTHTDTHTACLIDHAGREIATVTVEATPDGYAGLLDWAVRARHPVRGWSGRWKAAAHTEPGWCACCWRPARRVVEAGRPERVGRRPGGKSDPADARLAARTALTARSSRAAAQRRRPGSAAHPAGGPRPRQHHPHRRGQRLQVAAADRPGPAARAAAPAIDTPADRRLRRAARPRPSQRRPSGSCDRRCAASPSRFACWTRRSAPTNANSATSSQPSMPALLAEPGVGPVSAAHLIVAWSHRGRCRSEAAFAALAGVSPLRGVLRPRHPPSPQPLRRPPTQPRPPHDRELAHDPRPRTNPALPHPPTGPTEDRRRDPPLPQALHRPPPVPPHGDRHDYLTGHRSVKADTAERSKLARPYI